MQLPRSVVIGHGVLSEVGKVCKGLKLSGLAVVVTGPTTKYSAGKRVHQILSDEGYDVDMIEVKSTNDYDIEEVKILTQKTRARFMLGVGGGKSIDVAKFVSNELDIPFLSIPTAASHDGIASF